MQKLCLVIKYLLQGHALQFLSLDGKAVLSCVNLQVHSCCCWTHSSISERNNQSYLKMRVSCFRDSSISTALQESWNIASFLGKTKYVDTCTRKLFSSCLILAALVNVGTPARQWNAERAVCSAQHNQIKVSASAEWEQTGWHAQNLHGGEWDFIYACIWTVSVT